MLCLLPLNWQGVPAPTAVAVSSPCSGQQARPKRAHHDPRRQRAAHGWRSWNRLRFRARRARRRSEEVPRGGSRHWGNARCRRRNRSISPDPPRQRSQARLRPWGRLTHTRRRASNGQGRSRRASLRYTRPDGLEFPLQLLRLQFQSIDLFEVSRCGGSGAANGRKIILAIQRR